MQSSKTPCRYFQKRGECFYGDSCAFAHVPAPGSAAAAAAGGSSGSSGSAAAGPQLGATSVPVSVPTVYEYVNMATAGGGGSGGGASALKPTIPEFKPASAYAPPEFYPTTQGGMDPSGGLGVGPVGAGGGGGLSAAAAAAQSFLPSAASPEFNPGAPMYAGGPQAHEMLYAMGDPNQMAMGNPYMFATAASQVARDVLMSRSAASLFISNELRQELMSRQMAIGITLDTPHPSIPQEVDNYHSLVPLEHQSPDAGQVLRLPSAVYKAFCVTDGLPYCLRRIMGYRLTESKSMQFVDLWKKVNHPNVIALKEVFTTKDFQDHSVVFVYEYHPNCETLLNRHFSGPPTPIPEQLLWTYIIQMTSALRTIHSLNLACRVFEPSKILVSGHSRILLSSTCIIDVLQFDAGQAMNMTLYQQEDLVNLGKIILQLACGSLAAATREAAPQSMSVVKATYSDDVFRMIRFLLTPGRNARSVNELMPLIGARFYIELDNNLKYTDFLEMELMKEMQNGRLFRVASKLLFVTDRPELAMDPRWVETGDRYLLKLLRSYIFHQVTETGRPWMDLAHVVQCLNKLDVGSMEKCCLVSPDEKNVMVVSYKDLKRCLATAYSEMSAP
eukprot:m.140121 g.140121  ORF g.140121 m.140121 type:complete len:615 (-) comp16664_c0_seq2:177-2021(-)